MIAIYVIAGLVLYAAMAALTMRALAWTAKWTGGKRDPDTEVVMGLCWPASIPLAVVLIVFCVLHDFATRGLKEPK